MSLSMITSEAAPLRADLNAFSGMSPDEWIPGKVVRIAPFGAFVEVPPPSGEGVATGLVHVSQLADGFVDDVGSIVEVGQEVQVRVTSVDPENNKLGLSMKEAGAGGAPARGPQDLSAF